MLGFKGGIGGLEGHYKTARTFGAGLWDFSLAALDVTAYMLTKGAI